jgi:hypothetical protein
MRMGKMERCGLASGKKDNFPTERADSIAEAKVNGR